MLKVAAVVSLFSAIAGCSPQESPNTAAAVQKRAVAAVVAEANPAPTIDTTTPDKALKSYWAVNDWIRATGFKKIDKAFHATANRAREQVTSGAVRKNMTRDDYVLQLFDREIETVKVETESRAVAVVTIKNVTPIPEGADQEPRTLKVRESGERYKYVLEKSEFGWGVSEISEWDDWGKQWRKTYLTSAKGPMVPHMTYEGR